MNATLAMTLRELDENRYVFALALLTGLLPFGLLLANPRLDLGTTALIIAAALGGAIALMTGSGSIAGPLADGNLSFFFSQPVSGGAIWIGKMLGAILTSLAAAILALLPIWLTGSLQQFTAVVWTLGALGIVAFVFWAHALGIALRARSLWLLLDILGISISTSVIFQLSRIILPLTYLESPLTERLLSLFVVLASLAILAAIIAGGIQTIVGRTESTRSHRSLSCTFWSVVAAGLAATFACCLWLTHPKINELDFVSRLTAAKTGPWLVLEGFDEDRLPGISVGRQFLLDVDSGHSLPIDTGAGWLTLRNWVFSADGRRLMGHRRYGLGTAMPVLFADLETSRPIIEETGWQTAYESLLAFDEDGSRVAILDGRLRLRVLDPVERKSLTMWRLEVPSAPREFFGRLDFLGPETLRATLIDRRMRTTAMVLDIDLQKKETQVIRRVSGKFIELAGGPSPILEIQREGGTGLLDVLRLDGETSDEHDSSLDVWIEIPDRLIRARNLGASTAYIVKEREKNWDLRFLTQTEPGPSSVPLEGSAYLLFAGLHHDEVVVLRHDPLQLLRVSISTGSTTSLDDGLRPLGHLRFGSTNSVQSGSIGARILHNTEGDLVLLDGDGRLEKVLVKAKSRASR